MQPYRTRRRRRAGHRVFRSLPEFAPGYSPYGLAYGSLSNRRVAGWPMVKPGIAPAPADPGAPSSPAVTESSPFPLCPSIRRRW